MKFIVDTNILFSFFWKHSLTNKLLMNQELVLFAPEYALEEINKYKQDILRKAKITETTFKTARHDLALAVTFLPLEEYKKHLKQAASISPDPHDCDFFALALELQLPIWSNDTQLKTQHTIQVVTTKDLLNNPEFTDIVAPQ